MQCPIDQSTLAITERKGIEIDYCPQCRGVWLDRGELDKLIEAGGSDAAREPAYREERPPQRDERYYKDDRSHGNYKKRKKESFLSDLFDF